MDGILAAALSISLGAGAAAEAAGPGPSCLPDGSGFLTARLRGAVEADLDWHGADLDCTGMPRPDGQGLRLRFAGRLPDGGQLALVFAPPVLAEGQDARAVPVNVTILDESGGRIFGTRGEDRCLLDEVFQERVESTEEDSRLWAVEARGFCTEPARALDDSGAVLLTRFDFRGRVTLRDEPANSGDAGGAP
jgi:hypothetical protein